MEHYIGMDCLNVVGVSEHDGSLFNVYTLEREGPQVLSIVHLCIVFRKESPLCSLAARLCVAQCSPSVQHATHLRVRWRSSPSVSPLTSWRLNDPPTRTLPRGESMYQFNELECRLISILCPLQRGLVIESQYRQASQVRCWWR